MKNFSIANVLDAEWSCFANGQTPPGEVREVICFGACVLDLETLTLSKKLIIPVIPTRSSISEFCTHLTGWTKRKLLKQGVPFEKALQILARRGARNRLTIIDSSNEVEAIRKQCEELNLECPFGTEQLNVSTLFTLFTGAPRNLSLPEKLQYFGMQFEGRRHRPDDDAWNIGRLFIKLTELGRAAILTDRLRTPTFEDQGTRVCEPKIIAASAPPFSLTIRGLEEGSSGESNA